MVYDEIFFGGEVLPCVVEKFPKIRKAQRKYKTYNIPGRNGDIIIQQDAYENVILPYRVYCGEGEGVQTDWDDLANVLYKDGYQILSDIADPGHYRKAVFNGPIDADYYWKQTGRTTIEFNCRPERYRLDGKEPRSYAVTTRDVVKWNYADLSTFLKNVSWPSGTEEFYEFTIDPSLGNEIYLYNFSNCYGDGRVRYAAFVSGTPGTMSGGTVGTVKYFFLGHMTTTYQVTYTLLIPAQYFDGAPMLALKNANEVVTHYGTDGVNGPINNDYMPCFPDLILHNVESHTGEVLAAHINQYGIYITYDADSPYYFVDTENMTITKSDALNGNRMLASNARMDSGIKIEKGENIIYTSSQYEIPSIIPNLWEL